jgi:hypothetical protein
MLALFFMPLTHINLLIEKSKNERKTFVFFKLV